MAKRKLRRKIPQLRQAVPGRFSEHHAIWCANYSPMSTTSAGSRTARQPSRELIAPFTTARELFVTIPGMQTGPLRSIIAEIGVDMARFPSPAHLASWAGLCPATTNRPANIAPARPARATRGCSPHSSKRPGRPHAARAPRCRPGSGGSPNGADARRAADRRRPPPPRDHLVDALRERPLQRDGRRLPADAVSIPRNEHANSSTARTARPQGHTRTRGSLTLALRRRNRRSTRPKKLRHTP